MSNRRRCKSSSRFSGSRGERQQGSCALAGPAGPLFVQRITVGGIVLLSHSGAAPCFQDISAPGGRKRGAKAVIVAYESHPVGEIVDITVFEPQAAASVRGGLAIARGIGCQQRFSHRE